MAGSVFKGGVPEWLKGTGCKPVGVRLRWFESNLLHHRLVNTGVEDERGIKAAFGALMWTGRV